MEKVKILAVGIGGYANVWLKGLFESDRIDYEIVGAVDVYPQGSNYYNQLKDMSVPFYKEMEDFYTESQADLAIITTPIHLHTRHILCALKHGSHVMCEKPLCGNSMDEKIISEESMHANRFVMVGYQWSYSEAIQKLKQDILSDSFGKALSMKTAVFWPRSRDYFTRGSGWAGKLKATDGTVMNDSVANNAAAHYLHNMLYLLGNQIDRSAEALSVESTLLRANNIENFDTAEIRFVSENGCKCTFLATHTTEKVLDPIFEYCFEKGKVVFDEKDHRIIALLKNGEEIDYGDPFENINHKIFLAIDNVKNNCLTNICGVKTAAAHVRCIEQVQRFPIYNVVTEALDEKDNTIFVKHLYDEMLACYQNDIKLKDSQYFDWWTVNG